MSSIPPDEAILPGAFAQAWRADQASTTELRRGYARFMRQQRSASRRPPFVRWLVGGLVLGLGLAQAASAASTRWFGAHEVPAPAPAPLSAHLLPAHVVGASRAIVEPEAPSLAPPSPALVPSAQPPNLQRNAPRPRAGEVAADPYTQEQWQHAAAALRENDFVRAQQALLEVEHHNEGAERDAARLARAQLLASHGRAEQALTLASELQARAESPLVREKARALVARLSKNGTVDRSNQPAAAVNQP